MSTSTLTLNFGAVKMAWGRIGIVATFVVFIGTIATIEPQFLSRGNLMDVVTVACIYLLISFGETFVIGAGGVDLSVGHISGFSALVASLLMSSVGLPVWIAVLLGMLTGFLLGTINGFIVGWLGVDSFVTTLSTMFLITGTKYWMTGGMSVMYLPGAFLNLGRGTFLNVPFLFYILLAGFVFSYLVFSRLRSGRNMYMTGGNILASYLSGISVRYYTLLAFILSGILSSITGILLAARAGHTNITLGEGLLLDAFAMSLLGGVLAGGRASITGTLVGGFFLMMTINGLNMLGVNPAAESLIKGVLLMILVIFSIGSKKRR
ncbi:MAG: ABC transporter permease [Desulfobacterales bacterium]|nr:MAG: ABC transporter permease [Desulfobacterales bacterium]